MDGHNPSCMDGHNPSRRHNPWSMRSFFLILNFRLVLRPEALGQFVALDSQATAFSVNSMHEVLIFAAASKHLCVARIFPEGRWPAVHIYVVRPLGGCTCARSFGGTTSLPGGLDPERRRPRGFDLLRLCFCSILPTIVGFVWHHLHQLTVSSLLPHALHWRRTFWHGSVFSVYTYTSI